MPFKLIMPIIMFAFFAMSAKADVSPPWWCFDTPEQGHFCGHYKASTPELAFVRAADDAKAKMCNAFDCVQSPDDGIGPAVRVSQTMGFKIIKSASIVNDGTVHHFTLIKAQ